MDKLRKYIDERLEKDGKIVMLSQLEMKAEDLGHIMCCQPDFETTPAYCPNVYLKRSRTLMKGDDYCDTTYCWKKQTPMNQWEEFHYICYFLSLTYLLFTMTGEVQRAGGDIEMSDEKKTEATQPDRRRKGDPKKGRRKCALGMEALSTKDYYLVAQSVLLR